MEQDPWLENWLTLLHEATPSKKILELGCDTGRDTQFLVQQGFHVVATDISKDALIECALKAPAAKIIQLDLQDPFPFESCSFETIISSLSLHYFSLKKTQEILAEISRCLTPHGLFICRVNSTRDINHGASGFPEIEPNYY